MKYVIVAKLILLSLREYICNMNFQVDIGLYLTSNGIYIKIRKDYLMKNKGINSKAVHGGKFHDEAGFGLSTPIFRSTASIFPNGTGSYKYPRYNNTLTQEAVSEKIAILENGESAKVFSSGMAAITTVIFTFLKNGDHAIFQTGLYGGTQNFILRELSDYGIEYDIINSIDPADFKKAIKENTKLIYIETPSNPLLTVIDIEAIANIARENNITTAIDSTFASPVNTNPLDLGIDIVIHSGTKYLGGHSDLLCGAVVCSGNNMEKIHEIARSHGGSLDPHACFLLERSLKTLGLRVAVHNTNALAIARLLESSDMVTQVNYPGLESHPNHTVAKKQMRGYGGMLSFDLDCDLAAAREFVSKLQFVAPAVSLGGVESTLCFSAETSHSKLTAEERAEQGITDTLIRLSVGIEDIDDLKADFTVALSSISKKAVSA